MRLQFRVHPGVFAVCRLDASALVPEWAAGEGFVSISRTPFELSIVCPQEAVLADVRCQGGWRLLELAGPFSFEQTGILAAILHPLAQAQVPIFALSTYDTDWILVPENKLEVAVRALAAAGHRQL
jgi:uncharacterized protein